MDIYSEVDSAAVSVGVVAGDYAGAASACRRD